MLTTVNLSSVFLSCVCVSYNCISQGSESHSLRGGQGVCLPDSVRGEKLNFDHFQLADTTGQITLHWPTLCSCSLPDSTEPLLTPLPAPSFSLSNAPSPLYKSNWIQPCSLFPTAVVYYWLKSVLIFLTRFWLCVYSTFNTHPDNLMHMHIYAYTNTTMGPPGPVQLTPSYQQSSSAFSFRNWHPSSSSGQLRPPTHQPGLRKCLISDLFDIELKAPSSDHGNTANLWTHIWWRAMKLDFACADHQLPHFSLLPIIYLHMSDHPALHPINCNPSPGSGRQIWDRHVPHLLADQSHKIKLQFFPQKLMPE